MLLNFITWLFMLCFSVCLGIYAKKGWTLFIHRECSAHFFTWDLIIISGICLINVYAQFFSLFYKVGAVANWILLILIAVGFPVIRREFKNLIDISTKNDWKKPVVLSAILLFMLYVSSFPPDHYDTALYHAQAIRWIEEYGIVKGLGCLHGRLAFNSALMPLQALFGYRYLFGVEVHSVNGFAGFILLSWAVLSMHVWKDGKIRISDAMKVVCVFYMYTIVKDISSPSTDLLAVGIVIYVFAKWLELIETDQREVPYYIYLCFFVLYAMTLKLSCAFLLVIAVYPLVILIKDRRYKLMGQGFAIGVGTILPFLIRNVVLSGWLLYPVPFIDVFSVDWKLPLEKVIREKDEITAWARVLNDVGKLNWKVSQWFPVWFQAIGRLWRKVFILSIIGQTAAVVRCMCLIKGSRTDFYKISMLFIYLVEFTICFTWFFTAPSIRFGGIFCTFPGVTLLGEAFSGFFRKVPIQNTVYGVGKNRMTGRVFIALILCLIAGRTWIAIYSRTANFLYPGSYAEYPVTSKEVDGVEFYYPIEGDQTGYECFPAMLPGGEYSFQLREWGNIKGGFQAR